MMRDDVVFQGASVAFDLSMEEIWVPYLVGATLFVATPEIMGEADACPTVLWPMPASPCSIRCRRCWR
jgi:hypothetical protein